jgi:hypothetical protein
MAFDKFDFVLFPAASHHWVRRGPSSGYDSDHSLHCRGNNPKKGGGGVFSSTSPQRGKIDPLP